MRRFPALTAGKHLGSKWPLVRFAGGPATLGRPPPGGWFVLDVVRERWPKWDWVAMMVNFDPDQPCWPTERKPAYVRIPGKHRNRNAAYDALEDMLATRH